jgi:hypothetical protein
MKPNFQHPDMAESRKSCSTVPLMYKPSFGTESNIIGGAKSRFIDGYWPITIDSYRITPDVSTFIQKGNKHLLKLKGKSHEILDPIFSLNGTPGFPDSWAKAVLNIDSNSQRNSIRFFAKLKILFYCHEEGKITNGWFFRHTVTVSVKAERISFRLRAMSKNSALCQRTPCYAA